MRLKLFLSIIALTLISGLSAEASLTKNIGKVKDGYNFWLYTPDNADGKTVGNKEKKPVFIFLHGASLCGNDLDRVKRYGTIDAIEKGRNIDGYVIAPQNPGGSWNPQKVMNILEWVESNYNVDKERVYVLGMSLGGYGTIDMAATFPDRIAAAIAMCGGGTVKNLSNLNELPLWIIHGTGDSSVSVKESDKVVNAIKNISKGEAPRLSYDRIPGMNHSKPARMFYLEESYDWLLNHSLSDKARKIADTFNVNSLLGNAYKGLKFSKSKSSRRKHSTGSKTKSKKRRARTSSK